LDDTFFVEQTLLLSKRKQVNVSSKSH
jgi:hypothetical protein